MKPLPTTAGLLAIQLALVFGAVPVRAAESPGDPSATNKSIKLYGELDIISSSYAAAGISLSAKILPATIEKIRLGSPALYSGLAKNDRVLSARVSDNKLSLIIERQGRRFSAQLQTAPTKLDPQIVKSAQVLDGKNSVEKSDISTERRTASVSLDRLYIVVRMGLCGAWDVAGPGRHRWDVLERELGWHDLAAPSTAMNEAWQDWRRAIALQVRWQLAKLGPFAGIASVHVVLTPEGHVGEVTAYNGPERPMAHIIPDTVLTSKLIKAIRSIALPPFPAGSQATEAHVLIYVTDDIRVAENPGYTDPKSRLVWFAPPL